MHVLIRLRSVHPNAQVSRPTSSILRHQPIVEVCDPDSRLRAQIKNQAREQAGQGRTEYAGTPQVVAQTELVDETGEQVEVAVGEWLATDIIENLEGRFEKLDESDSLQQMRKIELVQMSACSWTQVVDDGVSCSYLCLCPPLGIIRKAPTGSVARSLLAEAASLISAVRHSSAADLRCCRSS